MNGIERRRIDMQECCANCKRWLKLVKYDYSHGGCDHSDMGHCCTVFMNEGQIVWMVGNNPEVGQCEAYIPKEG